MPLEPPPTDRTFVSREEVTDWLKVWSIPQGYDVRIVRSNKRSRAIEYCCVKGGNRYVDRSTGQRAAHTRKTDCQFRVRAKMYSGSESYTLSVLNPDHNHDPAWTDAPPAKKPRRKPPPQDAQGAELQMAQALPLPGSGAGAPASAATVSAPRSQPRPPATSHGIHGAQANGMVAARMPLMGIPSVPGVRASLTLSESISLITADEARGLLLTYANSHRPLANALIALVEAKHGSVGSRGPELIGGNTYRASHFVPPAIPPQPLQPMHQAHPPQPMHQAHPPLPPPAVRAARPTQPPHATNLSYQNQPGAMAQVTQNEGDAQSVDDSDSGESGESGGESEDSGQS